MTKLILLIVGLALSLFQNFVLEIDVKLQFIIFLIGILILGVPHGAADLLVANNSATNNARNFSKIKFLANYLSRLFLFGFTLYFFPLIGNILFLLFAAYHFGETDLHHFKTDTLIGKFFVLTYGLMILSIILLQHFEEVMPVYQLFEAGKAHSSLILWVDENRYLLISIIGILFFTSTFLYFLKNKDFHKNEKGYFLIRLACILVILFNLPMLLGFTFYFVVWHSVLSLKNIVGYLNTNKNISTTTIQKEILLYSVLAMVGIAVFGLMGFMFISTDAIAAYLFLSLAVLTAPHMQVMYEMYQVLRSK